MKGFLICKLNGPLRNVHNTSTRRFSVVPGVKSGRYRNILRGSHDRRREVKHDAGHRE